MGDGLLSKGRWATEQGEMGCYGVRGGGLLLSKGR